MQRILISRDGNVAIIVALAILPLLYIVLSSIDYSRQIGAKNQLQAVTDSAALAAASLQHDQDPALVAQAWLDTYKIADAVQDPVFDISVREDATSREVRIEADYELVAYAPQFGENATKLPISVSSTAYEKVYNIEVALVLDVSSSMNGSRITELRAATKSFLELILAGDLVDRTSVTLVPYGGTVNMRNYFDLHPGMPADWTGCFDETSTQQVGMKFDTSTVDHTPNFWKWNYTNPWCPKDSARLVGHSNDLKFLKSEVDGWELSDGTGSDIGTVWGARSLDPQWQGVLQQDFADRPGPYNASDTLKFLIVMTDGGITAQYRPSSVDESYESLQGGQNQTTMYSKGTASDIFETACSNAKAEGVRIFTIAYNVSKEDQKELMKACSGEENYFDAESNELESTFAEIAGNMSELRISK